MLKILTTIVILSNLFVMPLTVITSAGISGFSFEDIDPLVDIQVTVEIEKIRSLEKHDVQVHTKEEIDRYSEPDFYLKIFINDVEFQSDIWRDTRYIYDPQYSVTLDVPDTEELVTIKIQLWDAADEQYKIDRLCDISGDPNDYDVELTYSIKTGRWWGDDFLKNSSDLVDPSGYGRLNGCDDGTIYKPDRDCELWFTIYQTDYDGDMIPYWAEVNIYNTDPMVDNSLEDPDGDGIPTAWEWRWGYQPLEPENHEMFDVDDDGLNNIEEYRTAQWFSDPFRKDVFVELDQMADSPSGEQSRLPEQSKELLYTAFDRQNIVLHIDDGEMGGSDIIPFDEMTTYNELNSMYWNYFLHGDSDNWRRGVFHYGLVIYCADGPPGFIFRRNAYQISSKGMEEKTKNPLLERNTVYASAYMHELGHTFGFWPIYGHNQWSMYPWQIGWWLYRPYKSCMNYAYMYYTVDYSDGSRPILDLDDWSRMDLTHFQGN